MPLSAGRLRATLSIVNLCGNRSDMNLRISLWRLVAVILLVFGASVLPVPGGPAVAVAAGPESVKLVPMKFLLVRAAQCSENCPEWIAAEGDITDGTPAQFRKFLKTIGKRNPPVVLQSGGGNVNGAFALGRLIRARGLETTVGNTRLEGCTVKDPLCKQGIAKSGPSVGRAFSMGAYCLSACPFVLSAGVVRSAAHWSLIGVHEMTIFYKRLEIKYEVTQKIVNGKRKEVRREVGRKIKNTGSAEKMDKKAEKQLIAYLGEMGVSADIVRPIREAKPSEMRLLAITEAVSLNVINEVLGASTMPGLKRCVGGQDSQPQPRCRPASPVPGVEILKATIMPIPPGPTAPTGPTALTGPTAPTAPSLEALANGG